MQLMPPEHPISLPIDWSIATGLKRAYFCKYVIGEPVLHEKTNAWGEEKLIFN